MKGLGWGEVYSQGSTGLDLENNECLSDCTKAGRAECPTGAAAHDVVGVDAHTHAPQHQCFQLADEV
jgi:hypothetical protein